MNPTLLANKYAKALFDATIEESIVDIHDVAVQDKSDVEDVHTQLESLQELFQDEDVVAFFAHPSIQRKDQKQVFYDSLKKKNIELNKYMQSLTELLLDRRKLFLLPLIFIQYTNYYNDYKELIEIEVYSPISLSSDRREKLILKLEEKYQKRVKLIEKVDETIISGLVIKHGNEVFDGSLRSNLEQLKNNIVRST